MAEITLTKTRIRAGIWEGVLAGSPEAPALEVLHLERPVAGVTVAAVPDRPGDWLVRVPVPAEVLSEGVQTFLIRDAGTGETLSHFTIITGKKGRLITLSATGTPRVPLDPAAGRRVIDQLLAALSRANAG